jgi:hypothetical protein
VCTTGSSDCRSLSEGFENWAKYLKIITKATGPHFIIFEFVANDSPAQLLEDAATLRSLLVQD